MTGLGPARWIQPIMPGDAVAPVILDGTPLSDCITSWDEPRGEIGGLVRTLGNQDVPHLVLEGPESPLDVHQGRALEIEWRTGSESDYLALQSAHNRSGITGKIWVDRPTRSEWIGNGAQTVFVLPSKFAFTLVPFATRPPIVRVAGSEQTIVTGTPAAGEVQIDTATDSATLTFGTTPASGAAVTCDHYPLHTYSGVELGLGWQAFNSGTLSATFVLIVPRKAYS